MTLLENPAVRCVTRVELTDCLNCMNCTVTQQLVSIHTLSTQLHQTCGVKRVWTRIETNTAVHIPVPVNAVEQQSNLLSSTGCSHLAHSSRNSSSSSSDTNANCCRSWLTSSCNSLYWWWCWYWYWSWTIPLWSSNHHQSSCSPGNRHTNVWNFEISQQ